MRRLYSKNGGEYMTYSAYQNDKSLHMAADQYAQMYGGRFGCTDSGDFLIYRDSSGNTYIPVDGTYTIPHLTKRLQQATKRRYTVDLLTLWWVPIEEDELRDIPGFCHSILQAGGCSCPLA